jgi:hypothetical protein
MKETLILLLAIAAAGMNSGLKAGDPIGLDPFHSVLVSSEIMAELVLSEKEALETDFENASRDDLIAEVVDSVLNIRMKTGKYKGSALRVRIYFSQDLKMLEAKGRAQIWSEEDLCFDGGLSLKLYNGGEMRFRLTCDSLSASLSQGSVVYLKGEARALQVKATTGATFSGYEFETKTARVVASGGAKAKISASDYLNADASSKGFIGYVGEPGKVDVNTSLMGEVLKTVLE